MAWKWKRQLRGAQTARVRQAPAGTAHPGHNSTLTLALLKAFPKDLLKTGSAAHRIYIHTGEAGFCQERCAQVTFFAYDMLKTGSGNLPDKLIPSPNRFGFAIKIQGDPPRQMNRMVTTGH